MKQMLSTVRGGSFVSMIIAVVLGVTLVVSFVEAATTISTNISTDGTLSVSGAASASSTLMVTGAVTTYGAGTFGDAAADVNLFNGSLNASSTALFSGTVTTYGDAVIGDAVGDSVTANAYFTQLRIGTGTTFDQIGAVGTDELGVEGDAEIDGTLSIGTAASTTALRVGNDQASTISGIVFGFCSFSDVASFTASTTKFVHCTGATGVTTSHRVFVQATSSFESAYIIQAASSTASNVISLRVLNTSLDGGGDTTLGGTSVNFWAVR